MKRGFQEIYFDNNGLWVRQVSKELFHFIELIDWIEATGEKLDGKQYFVSLHAVDLLEITDKDIAVAVDSAGWDGDLTHHVKAESCFNHGLKAKLFEAEPENGWKKLFAEARKESYRISADPHEYQKLLRSTANYIGSTQLEMMRGDIDSAMKRYTTPRSDPAFQNTAIHSIAIGNVETDGPLAYASGYMGGVSGSPLEYPRKELAEAYILGHRLGVSVLRGQAEKPSWIK
jgi:hypothetical protein